MNDPANHEWHRLFSAALNDTITEAEKSRLAALLKASAEARQLWFLYHDNECSLAERKLPHVAAASSESPTAGRSWFQWRPLTAAAAGLVMGLFSASVVWAYAGSYSGRVISVLQESFESGPTPAVTSVPVEAGGWSGDYSEVVGEQQGVKPASGKKMLRFLRGDYEGKFIPESYSSDVFRLVDVRPYRHAFVDGGAVVQVTALFNGAAFPENESFNCTLTLFALDAGMVSHESLKADHALSTESLALSRSSRVSLDRDPATWQKVGNELRLPPNTDYLMIRMGMANDTKSRDKRRDSFAGHFADKVHLVIAQRPEISVP